MAIPVPEITRLDVAFGNAKHLPRMDEIPDEFKRWGNPWVRTVTRWFFKGLTNEERDALEVVDGVDKTQALAAIRAALVSFEPSHEHKEAGAAYLMSQWFKAPLPEQTP